MTEQIKNSAGYTYMFLMVSSTDGETAVEAASPVPAVEISKNGGAFAASTNAAVNVSDGWYVLVLTPTETNTNGPLVIRATEAASKEWREKLQVIDAVPDVNVASQDSALDANVVSFDGSFTLPDVTIADESMTALALRYLGSDVADARAAGELPEDIQFTPAGVIVRNGREEVNGSSLEVYEEDKATVAYTRAITTVETPVYIGGLS